MTVYVDPTPLTTDVQDRVVPDWAGPLSSPASTVHAVLTGRIKLGRAYHPDTVWDVWQSQADQLLEQNDAQTLLDLCGSVELVYPLEGMEWVEWEAQGYASSVATHIDSAVSYSADRVRNAVKGAASVGDVVPWWVYGLGAVAAVVALAWAAREVRG